MSSRATKGMTDTMAKRSSKKDFDREQMYQKIMPSLQSVPYKEDVLENDESEPVGESVSQGPHGAANLMEIVLRDMLDQPLKILRCCDCERCRNDIIALALNQLPAKYAILEAPELQQKITDLRSQYEVKGKSALIQAIQQVKANPRHDL